MSAKATSAASRRATRPASRSRRFPSARSRHGHPGAAGAANGPERRHLRRRGRRRQSRSALKPGMTATTRIIVDQRNNVVRVPEPGTALYSRRSRAPAHPQRRRRPPKRRSGSSATAAPVALRSTSGSTTTLTEIVGGDVKPDDQVIVRTQRDGAGRPMPLPRL